MLLLRSRVSIAAVVGLGGLLAATTFTFAAVTPRSHRHKPVHRGPATLVVPDVEGKAYVFAEGMLEDAGFAWRVAGPVHGFAANTVVAQTPAAGTAVLDTGAPVIVLALNRNPRYSEAGLAVDAAPFAGTSVRLPGMAAPRTTLHASKRPHVQPKPQVTTTSLPRVQVTTEHSQTTSTHPRSGVPAARKHHAAPRKHGTSHPRPRAFVVRGAPKEPLDEMPLTARAKLLADWVAAHRKPTPANVRHWLYQHAWIVAGARFGWWHGDEALQTLISVDRQVEREWKMGNRSEAVARRTLAEVHARTH